MIRGNLAKVSLNGQKWHPQNHSSAVCSLLFKISGGPTGSGQLARAGLLATALLLNACVSPPLATSPVPAPVPEAIQAQSAQQIRQNTIKQLLAQAESAQRRDALTRPAGNSAYDFYRRVQQLEPDNHQAASGIQSLVLQLVERARTALRQRAFNRVSRLLRASEQLAPGNALSAELRTELNRERTRANATKDTPESHTIPLPAAELSAKSTKISTLLASTAQRVRAQQLRVVIVARNDAEGRWIYSQLRNAVPGYRVRGDIKLGSPPRVLLLTP